MSLNPLIVLSLSTLIGATTVALTVDELTAVHENFTQAAAKVQVQHDQQLVEAATAMYQLNTGNGDVPTLEKLVALGYLKQEFLEREKVSTE